MFNDVLTVDECRSLISRLARCVFPFQCAHGRPSMIPILDLQSAAADASDKSFGLLHDVQGGFGFGREETDSGLGFVEAFRAWEIPG